MREGLELLGAILSLAGAFFFLASAVGILRLPDFFARMHAPTKAGTLGLAFLVLGSLVAGMAAGTASGFHWLEDFVLLAVVLLTLPVSAQVLAWSARRARRGPEGEPPPPGGSE